MVIPEDTGVELFIVYYSGWIEAVAVAVVPDKGASIVTVGADAN